MKTTTTSRAKAETKRSTKTQFYDSYHQKNDKYIKVIGRNNFTYFYILRFLHLACKNPSWSKQKILDVGCGVGTISLYLADLGAKVTGIDVSHRAISICQHAKKVLGMKNVTFKEQQLDSKKDTCTLVTCFEVIEHIEDDTAFLKKIKNKLAPGGILVLTTPSKENFLYKHGFYKKFDAEVGHLRRYTQASLRSLLLKNGFEILHQQHTEGILRNLLFTTKLGILIKFIKGPLIPLFHWIDELTIPVTGASDIAIIARKV